MQAGQQRVATKGNRTEESELRRSIEDWLDAVRTKDTDRLLSHYAPSVTTFDLAPPMVNRGRDAIRDKWLTWMSSFEGPIGYDFTEQHIDVHGDIAFLFSVNRIRGKQKGKDEPTDMHVRVTVGLRCVAGKWLVIHEHISLPFDMKTMKACLDARP